MKRDEENGRVRISIGKHGENEMYSSLLAHIMFTFVAFCSFATAFADKLVFLRVLGSLKEIRNSWILKCDV